MNMLKFALPVALATCLWAAMPVEASRGGGGRGGGGWSGGGYRGGSFGGSRGYAGYGGYRGYGGYGYRGYGGYGRGYGYGYGGAFYPWYGGGYWPYYGYGGYGSYGSGPYSTYNYYDYGTPSIVTPVLPTSTPLMTTSTEDYSYPPPSTEPTDNKAMVQVIVPADAKVWFDGTSTKQTGTDREFVTPKLTPGDNYSYTVKAQWMEDGKPVDRTMKVKVQANKVSLVDFEHPTAPKK